MTLKSEIEHKYYGYPTKNNLAQRVAQDIPGTFLCQFRHRLTLVADYFTDKEVILQSENGVLGQWTQAEGCKKKIDLINAGKRSD